MIKYSWLYLVCLLPLSKMYGQPQVTVSLQESIGGCGLQTNCEFDTICVDIVMTVDQAKTLDSYNVWVEYDGTVISREAFGVNNNLPIGDNTCVIANGVQDTDLEGPSFNPDHWRVAGVPGNGFPMEANTPYIVHTICFIILQPNLLNGQQICVGGNVSSLLTTVTFTDASSDINVPETCLTLNSSFVSCALLPVELLAFNAERQGRSAVLTWNTASEFNASHFEVQRAGEDKKFVTIGQVTAMGTTSELQSYKFIDEHPFIGTNFYRLRQVDFDNAVSTSEIRAVTFEDGLRGMQVYPNPVRNKLTITMDQPMHHCEFALMDMEGKVVLRHRGDGQLAVHHLDVSHLPNGVYQLIGTGPAAQWIERVVITD